MAGVKRRRVKTILQMEAAECGSASLGMVLGFFGRLAPLEELRVECGVSRDGSNAGNILKAARRYGLEAKGYRKDPQALRSMQGPMIIHWNFNHFVVLEGFRGGRAVINDPAFGRRTVGPEEFDQSFTGVVLTFTRGPEFRKGGGHPGILSAVRSRLRGAGSGLLFVFSAGLALVVPGLVIPAFTRMFIDNILLKGMRSWMTPLLIAMGLTALVRAAIVWLQEYFLLRLETRVALSGSSRFFWHVLRLPVEFFAQRYAGEVGTRVTINDSVATLLAGRLIGALLDLLMIAFYGVLLLRYDPLLTLVGAGFAGLSLVFLRLSSNHIRECNMRLLQDRGKLAGIAMGGLQVIETLKATGKESEFFSRWIGYQSKLMNSEQEVGLSAAYLAAVPALLAALNSGLVLVLGAARVLDGFLTLGSLMAFQVLMGSFLAPVHRLVNLGGALEQAREELSRLDDTLRYRLDEYAAAEDSGEGPQEAKLHGSVEVRDLSFGYSRMGGPLIESFNLTLKPGDRVALVGGSGSGKSTVARLIAGLYEPWSGEILFDGKPRREVPRPVLTNSLAMVDQDISMFSDTVKENLSLWDATLPEADLVTAARHAEIHEDISARSGGYDHRLEEDGRNFSGGQRQRMEIARALARGPRILILDEATSALDALTEKRVQEHLRARGCTCLIVAHRLSTIRDCDEIIVMEAGKIVERGTHEELSRAGGAYAQLIRTG